jgi:hypothetical protein
LAEARGVRRTLRHIGTRNGRALVNSFAELCVVVATRAAARHPISSTIRSAHCAMVWSSHASHSTRSTMVIAPEVGEPAVH